MNAGGWLGSSGAAGSRPTPGKLGKVTADLALAFGRQPPPPGPETLPREQQGQPCCQRQRVQALLVTGGFLAAAVQPALLGQRGERGIGRAVKPFQEPSDEGL